MNKFEKALRASMALEEAAFSAARQNEDWQAFGKASAALKPGMILESHTVGYERRTCAVSNASKMVPIASASVIAERRHVNQIAAYASLLNVIEFTNEVILTAAQKRQLEKLLTGEGVTYQLWWSVRRTDTGATALMLRNGGDWMVMYEDGSHTKNLWTTDIRVQNVSNKLKTTCPNMNGSWYLDKRVKAARKVKVVPTSLRTDAKNGRISIRQAQYVLVRPQGV